MNPNIPRKTRGNGALALEIETEDPDDLREKALAIVEELRDPKEDTGIVLVNAEQRPKLYERYLKALREVVSDPPINLAEKYYYRNSGRGLIGALAAIGFDGVYTYELLTYRLPENIGKPRRIDGESVWKFELSTKRTFGNVSPHPIIAPHGRDPVLYGIRGTDPKELLEGLKIIRSEPYEGYALFITNQATDAHLIYRKIYELKPHIPAYIEGRVKRKAKIGQHVYLEVEDDTDSIEAFFYRQKGYLRRIAELLEPGDYIGLLGGTRPPSGDWDMTFNVEKLRIYKLVDRIRYVNPRCPRCGKRLKSAGKGKGRKCPRCGRRGYLPKERIVERPKITTGVFVGIPDSRRHLLKPPRVKPVFGKHRKSIDRRPKRV